MIQFLVAVTVYWIILPAGAVAIGCALAWIIHRLLHPPVRRPGLIRLDTPTALRTLDKIGACPRGLLGTPTRDKAKAGPGTSLPSSRDAA